MRKSNWLWIPLVLFAAIACDEPDPNAPGSDPPIQNPPVDKDPTPQTGTGGESQTSEPDVTTNGAPAANEGSRIEGD